MSDILSPATSAQHPDPAPFRFIQRHGPFFGLYLKTILLSIVTLGIYSFWGRVAITRHLYSHTSFGNRSFDYHATGKEMFIGFLKGLAILLPIVAVFAGVIFLLPMLRVPLIIIGYLLAGLLLPPYLMLGKWRFWLSRSSYCNVRFSNNGTYEELRRIWIPGVLLSVVTLGFYYPVLQNRLQHFFTNHSRFGTLQFNYTGSGKEFFIICLKGVLLTLVTLGIYSFWYAAQVNRYIYSHTTFNGRAFKSTMTGGGLFAVSITNLFIVIFTLSLGFPIAVNRMYGYFFSNITLDVHPDEIATAAAGMDRGASALAHGIEEAANAIDAVAGII